MFGNESGADCMFIAQSLVGVLPKKGPWIVKRRRERDLNSRVQGTVDFESTAIPGYAISAADVGFSATVISMALTRCCMEIHLKGRDYDVKVEFDGEQTVRQALLEAGIHPSTVIVSYDGTILPHATVLSQSVQLLVITISSGG